LYEQLAEQFPDHPEHDHVLYEWAWVLREADQLEASDRVFQELRQRHPDSTLYPDATFRLAQRRFQTQEHAEALELVEELIDADAPRKLLEPALYLQGEIAATLKRWKDVAEPMQRLVREFPDGGWRRAAEYWIAEAQFRQDHFVEAQAMFDALGEATEEDPSPWLANVALRRAQCLAHQKQWSQARVAAQRVVADYPEFELRYEVDYVLGRCLASEGRMEDAREAYRRVIRSEQGGKSETAAMAQWMIGESYFHQKDYQAAIREYLRVEILYAYPTWQAAALLQTGKCYEFLGQTEKAHESYSRLIESFGETPFAQQAARRLNPANQATAPGNRPAS
jgi:TolA-binding protein